MPPTKRIEAAKHAIADYFEASSARAYSLHHLKEILHLNRHQWRLPIRTSPEEFAYFLMQTLGFRTMQLRAGHQPSITRYVPANASTYDLALSIKPDSYISHGSAAFSHGLTGTSPAAIYVNKEQGPKQHPAGKLTQESIDRAFTRPQRSSQHVFSGASSNIVLLNGKHTKCLQVGPARTREGAILRMTGLERTLIDIVVRPMYAGGVNKVLEAFASARGRISVSVLLKLLRTLDFVYPYHQAIGFLMQRANYPQQDLEKVLELDRLFDFYVAHGVGGLEYDSLWRVRYPKALSPNLS